MPTGEHSWAFNHEGTLPDLAGMVHNEADTAVFWEPSRHRQAERDCI